VGGLETRRASRANEHADDGNFREPLISGHRCTPLLSPARPYCDPRHRIFLSEVNLGFKEFLILD
jgi:hypothetical protein